MSSEVDIKLVQNSYDNLPIEIQRYFENMSNEDIFTLSQSVVVIAHKKMMKVRLQAFRDSLD